MCNMSSSSKSLQFIKGELLILEVKKVQHSILHLLHLYYISIVEKLGKTGKLNPYRLPPQYAVLSPI
ncbi:hypothetical protein BpHYR1_041536 [Brachionus plicatilis]|uniref:Uncharacterized protein n=1 Tax=Brachionus plicatilis TaxID=10195 RepID=A0A3M7S345_BRAPC|nr:hypothetical protein BpHYR1_041536 [Brachionus plicatilis]